MTATADALTLSAFQERVLMVPESFDLALLGGRGGGKSYAIAHLLIRHAAQYAANARAVYVRRSFPGLADFENVLRLLVPLAFPGAEYSSQSHVWRIPNNAMLELGIVDGPESWLRWHGRSATLVAVDEAGDYPDLSLVERLRSNLRGPDGMPLRFVIAANPGGAGHAEVFRRFAAGREPWQPYLEQKSGSTWVTAPSTYVDNEHIDRNRYAAQIVAATAGDPELGRAWLEGDWNIARGSYFGAVIDEARVALDSTLWTPQGEYLNEHATVLRGEMFPNPLWFSSDPPPARRERALDLYLAHDFGAAAPSVTYVVGRSRGFTGPDGRWYPPESILLLDELATNDPENLNQGLGWTVPKLAEAIRDLAKTWGMEPRGCADDAIFAKTGSGLGSIADEFRREGVYFYRARKADRVSGWSRMRSMLAAAGSPDQPGLYVSRRCAYWWQTVPSLPRDPRRPEDLDSRSADHAADSCRYGINYEKSSPDFSHFQL